MGAPLTPENLIPRISGDYPFNIPPSTQDTFTLIGVNFRVDTKLTIPGFEGTVDNVVILSPFELEFTITSGPTIAIYDIVLTNVASNTEWLGNGEDLISVESYDWIDLRDGGDTFTHGNAAGNNIRYKSGMDLGRDAAGMWFIGFDPWASWVKFECLGWVRGEGKTVQWIFTAPTASFMIGIGSDMTDEGSNIQYNQAEVEAYFSGSTWFSSLYGNNGTPGSTGYHSNGVSLTGHTSFKIKFTVDGEAGVGVFTLYSLPSTSQGYWNDEATVLKTFTIGGTLAPDEPNLMPFMIPRNGGAQRFVAVKVA